MSAEVSNTTDQSGEEEQVNSLPVGTVIGARYEILAFVGRGGMGEVYKVRDQKTASIFALKMISPHLAQQKLLAKRLEHEAQAARTLVHGNIASVYEVGTTDGGQPYMILDYIDGDSLEALLKKETVLPVERAMGIFLQIADALVHARLKSIVHRDLKPSNILITRGDSGQDLVKIVDFGIAKISDQDRADKTKLTQTGELLGTPLYMSPEQCRGDEIDERSDIYSFGCIMHEVLSGKPAFTAENSVRVILKHLGDEPPPLPNNVGISDDLKKVILRCLEKSPADRYANAGELQVDLEHVRDNIPIAPHKAKKRAELSGASPAFKNRLFAVIALACISVVGFEVWLSNSRSQEVVTTKSETTSSRPEAYHGKSLSQWTTYIERHPDDPEGYYSRGYLHSLRDERTNAVDDYSEALKLKPDYIEALKRRATEYVMLAKTDLAEKDADQIIAMAPDSASSFESRGSVYQAKEQYLESIADWKKAISLDENNAFYYYMLGTSLLKMGDFDGASGAIAEAVARENQAPGSYHSVSSLAYLFKQDLAKGKDEAEAATNDPESRAVEWSIMAYYHVVTGNMPEAVKALKHAREIETYPARAFRLAGEVYRTAGMYDQAIKEFSSGTSLEEYPPGYRERAVTYIQLEQWRSALADLNKSYSLNPYSPTTASFLALVEDHLGMTKEATAHLAQAFKSKSLPPIVYVNRATIELAHSDRKAAMADANKALSIDRFLKEGYQIRAKVNTASGDTAAAQKDADKAAKLFSQLDY